jgi:hypothetical protein
LPQTAPSCSPRQITTRHATAEADRGGIDHPRVVSPTWIWLQGVIVVLVLASMVIATIKLLS